MKKLFYYLGAAVMLCAVKVTACPPEESNVVTADPVIWQQTSIDIAEPSEAEPTDETEIAPQGGAGMQLVIGDKTKIVIIPVSYILPMSLAGRITVGAGIPWITRKTTTGSESGMGDISFNVNYDYGDEVYLRSIYTFIIKVPTGDAEKALGRGSTDIAIAFSGIRRINAFRLMGNIGYRYNGDYEDAGVTYKYGGVFNLLVGTEYKLNPQLFPYVYLRMVQIAEGEAIFGGFSYPSQDDMTAVDLIVGARYKMLGSISLSGGLEIPASRTYNSTVTTEPDSKVTLTLKANYSF